MTSNELKTLLTKNSITQSELARHMSKGGGYSSLVNRWINGANISNSSEFRIKLAVQAINRNRQRVKSKYN